MKLDKILSHEPFSNFLKKLISGEEKLELSDQAI